MRTPFLLLFLALLPAAAGAQGAGDVPRRPRLPVEADSNDARAYFRLGQDVLARRPADAAAAFYWAAQIDPTWADPVYGRYAALLMSDPRRLVLYNQGDRRTLRHPDVLRLDSLYFRALRMDPFLRRQFDRELIRQYVMTLVSGPSRGAADQSLASFYTAGIMRDLPPLLRGRVLAGEGRLMEALHAYDEALRLNRGRRADPPRLLRHERGRLFALAGNDSMALVELDHAVQASVDEESSGTLAWFYQSKAVLEHSRGMVLERAGDPAGAREAYARALLEDLAYHPAHVRMGALALAEGDTAGALMALRLAAEVAADEPGARFPYAAALARENQLPEAEAELEAVTAMAPYYAEPWLLLGMVRAARGDPRAADAYRTFLERARRDDARRARVEPLAAPPAP